MNNGFEQPFFGEVVLFGRFLCGWKRPPKWGKIPSTDRNISQSGGRIHPWIETSSRLGDESLRGGKRPPDWETNPSVAENVLQIGGRFRTRFEGCCKCVWRYFGVMNA